MRSSRRCGQKGAMLSGWTTPAREGADPAERDQHGAQQDQCVRLRNLAATATAPAGLPNRRNQPRQARTGTGRVSVDGINHKSRRAVTARRVEEIDQLFDVAQPCLEDIEGEHIHRTSGSGTRRCRGCGVVGKAKAVKMQIVCRVAEPTRIKGRAEIVDRQAAAQRIGKTDGSRKTRADDEKAVREIDRDRDGTARPFEVDRAEVSRPELGTGVALGQAKQATRRRGTKVGGRGTRGQTEGAGCGEEAGKPKADAAKMRGHLVLRCSEHPLGSSTQLVCQNGRPSNCSYVTEGKILTSQEMQWCV